MMETEAHSPYAIEKAAISIKPVDRESLPDLKAYFRALTPDSLYRRLFATSHAVPAMVLSVINQDGYGETSAHPHSATTINAVFVARQKATDPISNQSFVPGPIVGEAMLSVDLNTGRAEVALSILDTARRQGIGSQLFKHLLQQAEQYPIQEIYADALRSNTAFITLAKSFGFDRRRHPEEWSLIRLSRAHLMVPNRPGHFSSF